jgi:hypothetical protein
VIGAAAALLALAADAAFIATYISEGDMTEPRPLLIVVSLGAAGLLAASQWSWARGFALATLGSWMVLGAGTLGLLLLPAFVMTVLATSNRVAAVRAPALGAGALAGFILVVVGLEFTP